MLTQERLKELMNYNAETGIFTWKEPRWYKGQCTTTVHWVSNGGHDGIRLNGHVYLAGRLAWLYEFGVYPNLIRRIDGDIHNHRISNLMNSVKKGEDYVLTQERLKELLNYSPLTGAFIWRKSQGGASAWTIAGTLGQHGYYYISVDGRHYKAARLAWLYMYGEMPDVIDHEDRCRANDRIANLRNGTHQQNRKNHGKRTSNTSGITGVYWSKHHQKWRVLINDDKMILLGYHDDFLEAVYTRWIAEGIYDYHPTHGR